MAKGLRLTMVVMMVLIGAGVGFAQEEEPAAEETAAAESAAADEGQSVEETEQPAAPQTSFKATVDFELEKTMTLDGQVLEVYVKEIEFVEKSAMKTGIKGAFNTSNDDLRSEITVRLNMSTDADTKQKIDVMVEFLDADAEVMDRTGNTFNFKERSKVFDFKHTTLKWVVPHVASARVTVKAKK